VRENQGIGLAPLIKKIYDMYGIQVPYMRVFYGKEMALDKIHGPWKESFKLLYTFKAKVEKACLASVVEIDRHTVQYKLRGKTMEKEYFRRVFVCFKACWKGFLDGCRPYLVVDATFLNERFKGFLVAANAIDAHNWLFPIAYGVLEKESVGSWTWFLQNLRQVIGFPNGLVIHTDACKGLKTAVDQVFPGVEHKECRRHLVANFGKQSKRKVVDNNLWPSALTYNLKKHNYHLSQLYTKAKVKEYLEKDRPKLWATSKLNDICKVDYVNNNLAESFNAWIRKVKGLHLVDMLDKIRQMIMAKFELRQKIASEKFVGHKIIPNVMKSLHGKTRSLKVTLTKCNPYEAVVTSIDKEKREWRYPVDLQKMTCSCRQWQITRLPCIHAFFFITSLRGRAAEIDQYVHEYYLVVKFNATYAENVPSMVRIQQ
jgi:zinc finger SWIM domain-containing protein 3